MWTMLCKRTEDPKLAWLEAKLTLARIDHRRNGESWHAPILEVDERRIDDAWAILTPVDDIPDDDPMWTDDPDGCSCGEPDGGLCAFCLVNGQVARCIREV